MKNWYNALLLFSILLIMCGCKSVARYDVHVKVDPDMRNASRRYPPVEVHLVVLDAQESDFMAQRSMTEYWRPGSRRDIYEDQKIKLLFGDDQPFSQDFLNRDSRWKEWKKYKDPTLWVLADLPGGHDDRPNDLRRLSVPLERTRWRFFYTRLLHIMLSRGRGLHRITRYKPSRSSYTKKVSSPKDSFSEMSDLPSVPDTPSVPQVPSVPEAPAIPSMPSIPLQP